LVLGNKLGLGYGGNSRWAGADCVEKVDGVVVGRRGRGGGETALKGVCGKGRHEGKREKSTRGRRDNKKQAGVQSYDGERGRWEMNGKTGSWGGEGEGGASRQMEGGAGGARPSKGGKHDGR